MITAVVYSEAGGTYKTTLTTNLAVAFQRMGLDVLVIDLDSQEADLTHLFEGVGETRSNPEADNIVRHILGKPKGDFKDLIETSNEGVDIVPAHDMLGEFTQKLEQKINFETQFDGDRDSFPRYELLHDLLWEKEQLNEVYDVVLIDPNARAEDLLFNAIYALRTLIAPVKPAGKGSLSLDGLSELVEGLETRLEIQVGLSCVVPSAVTNNNSHQEYARMFEEADEYPTPVRIGKRESLMDEMWGAKGSAFRVVEERWKATGNEEHDSVSEPGKRRVRERELETLQKIVKLAEYVATESFDQEIEPQVELDIQGKENRLLTSSSIKKLESGVSKE